MPSSESLHIAGLSRRFIQAPDRLPVAANLAAYWSATSVCRRGQRTYARRCRREPQRDLKSIRRPRRPVAWAKERAAGMRAGVAAAFDGDAAVDDHDVDADGILLRLLERAVVGDGLRIEDDDIGEEAFFDRAAIGELHLRRRAAGHLADRIRQLEHVLVADVAAENPRERAVGPWVRLAGAERTVRTDRRRVGADADPWEPHRRLHIVL